MPTLVLNIKNVRPEFFTELTQWVKPSPEFQTPLVSKITRKDPLLYIEYNGGPKQVHETPLGKIPSGGNDAMSLGRTSRGIIEMAEYFGASLASDGLEDSRKRFTEDAWKRSIDPGSNRTQKSAFDSLMPPFLDPEIPQEDPSEHMEADLSDTILDLHKQYKQTNDPKIQRQIENLTKKLASKQIGLLKSIAKNLRTAQHSDSDLPDWLAWMISEGYISSSEDLVSGEKAFYEQVVRLFPNWKKTLATAAHIVGEGGYLAKDEAHTAKDSSVKAAITIGARDPHKAAFWLSVDDDGSNYPKGRHS